MERLPPSAWLRGAGDNALAARSAVTSQAALPVLGLVLDSGTALDRAFATQAEHDLGLDRLPSVCTGSRGEGVVDSTDGIQKRTWCYIADPMSFDVAPCHCGNPMTHWSDLEGHCWCAECGIDFVPRHWGILDNPMPMALARRMALNFDRYDIVNDRVLPFDFNTGTYRDADPDTDRGSVHDATGEDPPTGEM